MILVIYNYQNRIKNLQINKWNYTLNFLAAQAHQLFRISLNTPLVLAYEINANPVYIISNSLLPMPDDNKIELSVVTDEEIVTQVSFTSNFHFLCL